MRLSFLLLTALLIAWPVGAQQEPASSEAAAVSPQQNSGGDLPVSLDRIREALKKPPEQRLKNLDVKPDFSVQVEEQARIDEILSKLDVKSGPVPPGGLYGFEQQRRLVNPVDRPLQQPYAAFSGGELITIALENLMVRYLGGRALDAVSDAERARAEAQARDDVARAIAEYCAGRPDRASIHLCNAPSSADVP
jgi:hypothetical protein